VPDIDVYLRKEIPDISPLGSGMTERLRGIVRSRHSLERRSSGVENLFGNKKG